jgi:hypothetical protein
LLRPCCPATAALQKVPLPIPSEPWAQTAELAVQLVVVVLLSQNWGAAQAAAAGAARAAAVVVDAVVVLVRAAAGAAAVWVAAASVLGGFLCTRWQIWRAICAAIQGWCVLRPKVLSVLNPRQPTKVGLSYTLCSHPTHCLC